MNWSKLYLNRRLLYLQDFQKALFFVKILDILAINLSAKAENM